MASLGEQFLRRKPVAAMAEETGADSDGGELKRTITLFQLTLFGIGATIGTGIFIVFSSAVPEAGPAVIFSFVFAGVVAGLTAICYAELASAVPVSGSSYSYAYATMGEGIAMIVAACLLLEYGVSAAAVAVGWSQYLNELLDNLFGFTIPEDISNAPEADGIINLPAVILVVLCALLLIRGASESAKVNAAMVIIKIGVLVLFIAVGITGWDSDNLSDFAPFGAGGVTAAAGIIFFSYIGLDAVSTAGEEVHNPRRNLPLAILIALAVVTTIYVLVAIVAVAAQPLADFEGQDAGLSAILEAVTGNTWPATVIAAGAVISIFSVTLVVIYGQTRILFAMAPRRHDPAVLPPAEPAHADAGAGHDRRRHADRDPRRAAADRVPRRDDEHRHAGGVPDRLDRRDGAAADARPTCRAASRSRCTRSSRCASIAGCIWIIQDLRAVTIYVFFGWSAVALVWYFFYGRHHARAREVVMTLVVGFAPDGRGRGVLHLAAHARPLVGRRPRRVRDHPLPLAAEPGAGGRRVAGGGRAHRQRGARPRARTAARGRPGALHRPARALDPGRPARGGRAARRAHRGSSPARWAAPEHGRLLHSSPVPVAIAPRGFRCPARRARDARDGGVLRRRRRPRGRRRDRRRPRRRVAPDRLVRRPLPPAVHRAASGAWPTTTMLTDWVREIEAAAPADARRGRPTCPPCRASCEAVDRLRRELGGGARGRRVGGGRRARRRLELGRARSRASSSARARRRSSATPPSRSSSSRAAWPPSSPRRPSQPERRRSAIPVSASRMTRSATSAE